MGAGRWVGRGDKEAADQAAVDAMRLMLDTVAMDGVVVIGEGEKDKAPMLFNGEQVGDGQRPAGRRRRRPARGNQADRATALPNAIAVIALAERGTMFFPGPAVYMDKIAVGPRGADAIDITLSASENVRRVAEAKGVAPADVAVVVLDRDRHESLIAELREVGAKVRLITDGDVAPSIADRARGNRRRPADGHRRHARGRDLGGGDQVPRRGDAGPAVAPRRRRAPEARRRRLRRRARAHGRRPGRRAPTCSSPRPASPTAPCSAASGYRAGRR